MKVWQTIITAGVSLMAVVGVGANAAPDQAQTEGYRSPSWAPDGKSVVYEQYTSGAPTKLLIKNITTHEVKELTTASDQIAMKPQWSPNGKKILFNDSVDEIYTIWPDGSHRTVISDGDSHNAVWSPDGDRIVFTEDENSLSVSGPDGTITFAEFIPGTYQNVKDFVWSPDAKRVIFAASHELHGVASPGIFSVDLSDIEDGTAQPQALTGS